MSNQETTRQTEELSRTEEAERYEERLRELAKTMHRDGETDDWEQ